jgi:transmembrane sensor
VRALADDPRLLAIAEAAARRPRGIGAALRALGQRRPSGRATGFGAALAAAMVIGAVLFSQGGQTYRTQIGERRAISLADGSTVELNTDSQVRVRLSKTQRRLILDKGQAMFAVAHDAGRPFIVTAGDTSVRAIGTRFEVYRAQDGVRVTLAEGRVRVSQAAKAGGPDAGPAPVILTAGERVEIGRAKPAAPVAVDVAAATGWTNGRLTFKDARLADAVAEVNRYSRRRVVLGQGAPADERVNGVFDAGDTEAFAAGMAAALDLKSAPRPDGGVELTGGGPGPA